MSKHKLKRPYFVKAKLMRNGWVELIDDDGECWHITMHKQSAGPIVCRHIRRAEMMESWERNEKKWREKQRVAAFGPPRLVPPTSPAA